VLGLYGARLLVLRVFKAKDIFPELYIAPRGLITILLFFAIPAKYVTENFNSGILLYSIIVTSIVMTWAMIAYARENSAKVEAAIMGEGEDEDVDVDALTVQQNAGAPLQSETLEAGGPELAEAASKQTEEPETTDAPRQESESPDDVPDPEKDEP